MPSVIVKRDLASVKRDLASVKRDLASVNRDLVGVKESLLPFLSVTALIAVSNAFIERAQDLRAPPP